MAVQTSVGDDDSPSGTLLSSSLFNSHPYDYTQPRRKGLSQRLFVQDISEEYYCNLCMLVLFKPMVAGCGCRFCYTCITDFIRDNESDAELQCPAKDCSEILQASEIQVDKFAKRFLERQRIYCENREHGCKEEMRFADLANHLLKCPFQTIECPNGCGQKLLPEEEDSHLARDCPHRMVPCEYCDQRFMQKDIEDHSLQCKKLSTPCPNACSSAWINPTRLQEHLENECPETRVNCPYNTLGCTNMCRRKELKDHLASSAEDHNGKLSAEFVKMKETLTELMLHMDQLRNVSSQAESASPELTGQVEKLGEMMKKLQLTMVQKFDKLGKLEKSSDNAAKKADLQTQVSRIDILASQATTLSNRIQKLEEKAGQGSRGRRGGASQQSLEQRVSTLENQISLHAMRLAEHDVRFQVHGTTSYNGCLVWKIKDYARRKRDADTGKTLSLYSQPFFTNRYGYKMCARVYLNGDGIGKDTHVSLFL